MRTRYPVAHLSVVIACVLVSLRAAEPLQVCGHLPALPAPDWIPHETIYEVNVRQYSAAGTFAAVEADLPRLRQLGVGVLWFMPVHPIGVQNRKGPLGSPYAVRDYYGINPEFGTEADFARLVDAAHAQGFHVILDWVGNHTAWDNPLVEQHPDFYVRDAQGHCVPPSGTDWTDVVQLDFGNHAVWDYEIAAMTHWIRRFGVDGFRCDFASGIPTAFWDEVSARLRAVRPDLFLLAEAEVPQEELHAFHASYSFEMMKVFNDVAAGRAPVSRIDDELARTRVLFPHGAMLMRYTTNHDENSWNGTVFERLGGGVEAFAVLTYLLDGIPLIYNGQEAGLDHRLKFFEHDPISWRPSPLTEFYRTRNCLRPARWMASSQTSRISARSLKRSGWPIAGRMGLAGFDLIKSPCPFGGKGYRGPSYTSRMIWQGTSGRGYGSPNRSPPRRSRPGAPGRKTVRNGLTAAGAGLIMAATRTQRTRHADLRSL